MSWAQTADSPLLAPRDTPLGVQIVANNRNGLDVDKYDYLQRDSMYSGTKISVDVKRIFPFVKVGLPCCGSWHAALPHRDTSGHRLSLLQHGQWLGLCAPCALARVPPRCIKESDA